MAAFHLSAYALSASDLTEQKKIDVSQIERRLKLSQTEIQINPELLGTHDLFMNAAGSGKRICILAEGGMMFMKGSLQMSSASGKAVMMQVKDMSIEQLSLLLQDLLKPNCHVINKTAAIQYAPAIMAEIIAVTDRQPFTWLCCRWN